MTATNRLPTRGILLPCAWPVCEEAVVPLSRKAQSAQATQLSTEKNCTRTHSPGAVGSCLTSVTLQLCHISGTPGIIASIRQSTWTFPGKSRSRSSTSHWPVLHFPPLLPLHLPPFSFPGFPHTLPHLPPAVHPDRSNGVWPCLPSVLRVSLL